MRIPSAAAGLLGLAVVLAACSSGAATPTTGSAPTPTPSPTPAQALDAPPTVAVSNTELGSILTGSDGLTLYVFLPDQAGQPTCYDGCATAWPPLLVDGTPTFGTGLAPSDFGTVTRTDGGTQVTFHGWPLYFYSGDASPGDTNGQGFNGNWFVIGADGSVINAPAPTDTQNEP